MTGTTFVDRIIREPGSMAGEFRRIGMRAGSGHGVLAALLGMAFLLLAGVSPAQSGGLTVNTWGGYGGYYRAGAWTPIFVEITNRPAAGAGLETIEDFKGQVLITSAPMGDYGSSMRFARPIDVPASSSKRYVLYARFPEDLPVPPRLVLTNEAGKILLQQPVDLNAAPKDSVLMATVTSEGSGTPLPRLRDRLDFALTSQLDPDHLGDHWAAFDSLDLIVFPEWPSEGLSAERVRALRDWVQMGGTLVFLGGMNSASYSDPVATELLPVEIRRSASLWELPDGRFKLAIEEDDPKPAGAKTSYVMALSYAKQGVEVLDDQEGFPLVARERHGLGQIVFFANDFKSGSISLEQALGSSWFPLVPVPNLAAAEPRLPEAIRTLKTLTGRAARAPNQFILILLCLVYMLVVGPVNFALLGRQKKLEWAWATVPAIVLFFFFLMYGMGRLTKGGDSIVREFVVEQYRQGDELGSATTITGVFVSNPERVFLTPVGTRQAIGDAWDWAAKDEFLRSDWGFGGAPGITQVAPTSDPPVITYDVRQENIQVQTWKMGVYDARTFLTRGPVTLAGGIEADLVWANNSLVGTVRNNTPYAFDSAWLAVGTELVLIGAMPPGKSVDLGSKGVFRLYALDQKGEPINADVRSGYRHAPSEFSSMVVNRPEENAEINANNFGELMRTLWYPPVSGKLLSPEEGRITFIGLRSEDKVAGMISNLVADVESRAVATLVELDVAPPPPGRGFTVPNPYLKKRLHLYEESLQTTGGQTNGTFRINSREQLEMASSLGILSVELPFSRPGIRVTEFSVNPYLVDELPSEDLQIEVFQYTPQPRWVVIEAGKTYPNEGVALPINGRMYIRLMSVKNDKQGLNVSWDARKKITSLGVTLVGTAEAPR